MCTVFRSMIMKVHTLTSGSKRTRDDSVEKKKTNRGGKDAVSRTEITFLLGLLCFASITAVWTSMLPSSALPGSRRGELQPTIMSSKEAMSDRNAAQSGERSRNVDGSSLATSPAECFQAQPRLVAQIQERLRGKADKVYSVGTSHSIQAQGTPPPRRLILASHGRLMWLDVDTRKSEVIHEGRGVYYGMFPADDSGETVWVVSRPHIWRPKETKEALLLIDLRAKRLLREVVIPSHFTHDAVRAGGSVFLADTGGGHVYELSVAGGLEHVVHSAVRQRCLTQPKLTLQLTFVFFS